MYPNIDKLKNILLQEHYISDDDSKAAEKVAHTSAEFVDTLIHQGVLTKPLLGQAIAESYKVPYIDLVVTAPRKETVIKLPEDIARKNRVLLLKEAAQGILLASDAPDKINTQELQALFPKQALHFVYALPEHMDVCYRLYDQPLETRFSRIITSGSRIAPDLVDEIIKDALTFKASDIHFEPQATEVVVRFRIDGNLRAAGKIPKEYYENILNKVKVESGMRIDEHLASQDGALQRHIQNLKADLRVSVVPTIEGEKIVMRVLGSYIQDFTLADIGLDAYHQTELERYAAKPFGMILTVGPTGSGKTTTLYSVVKLLNKPNVNITSIEDPVEYKIPGINQIQVREQSNMTFARGLRSIVRQDPNIILVGEIRDNETAEISVNAALTGHLLLSTFHANNAATAIPRLIDMGIEPFLLASTLEVIIAQRLVRKICQNCRYSLPITDAIREVRLQADQITPYFAKTDNVYAGKGCSVCNDTGYVGRTAVFEFIGVTPDMQELILHTPSTPEITALARAQGERSMFDDAILKVKSGLTTISELVRVVEIPKGKGVPHGHPH